MQTLKWTLVRHGECTLTEPGVYYGATDAPLTEEGRIQAMRVRVLLEGERFDAVFSSPLLRCMDTAGIIAKGKDAAIETVPDLREIDFGRWEGWHYSKARDEEPQQWAQLTHQGMDYVFPEGESGRMQAERTARALEHMKKKVPSGNVLIVTHHGNLRAALAHALGMSIDDGWHFKLEVGTVTRLEWVDGYAVLHGLGL